MKKKFSAVVAAILAASCMTVTSFAASVELNDSASADKESYASGETANVTVKLENPNEQDVTNVKLNFTVPDGLTVVDSANLSQTVDSIAAGESAEFNLQVTKNVVPADSSSTADPSSTAPAATDSSSKAAATNSNTNPSTGSNGYIALAGMSVLGAAIVICLKKKDKKATKTLALLLSIGIGIYSVPGIISVKADDSSASDSIADSSSIVDSSSEADSSDVDSSDVDSSEADDSSDVDSSSEVDSSEADDSEADDSEADDNSNLVNVTFECSDDDCFVLTPFDSTDYTITYSYSYDAEVEPGTISGKVVDAVTGISLADAAIELRAGENVTTGDALYTTTTDASGNFSFEEKVAGTFTIYVVKEGYVSASSVVSVADEDKSVSIGMTPITQNETQLRIVLTWDDSVADLDSHLSLPTVDGTGNVHIYYPTSKRSYVVDSETIADLDLDDQLYYGPETTTVYTLNSVGTYSFFVHDYTNKYSTDTVALSNSNAKVVVYLGNTEIATYNVPVNQTGTVWHVFDFDAETLTLTPSTEMGFNSTPGDVLDTFI